MLNRKTYFIREHTGLLKLSDTYDILDPETKAPLGIAKEKVSGLIQVLRFLIGKQHLPTTVKVFEGQDPKVEDRELFSIRRGFSVLRPKIEVCSPKGEVLGWFQRKVFSLGGAFRVFDAKGQEVAGVLGDWKGWNFKFVDKDGKEIGTVTKKWAGMGKELFTSADNYIINLSGDPAPGKALLLLAAGLAIDTVFKENNG